MTKGVTFIAAILLLFFALVHVYRYYWHIPVIFGTVSIPVWVSLPAIAIAAFLSFFLFKAARQL